RENVYLNGSILGLSRVEVDRRFDDIVAFAELESFIDEQVKHYSSGMYARLGFAVAVNVEPDILLVDEVLSVGDESFQRRGIDPGVDRPDLRRDYGLRITGVDVTYPEGRTSLLPGEPLTVTMSLDA